MFRSALPGSPGEGFFMPAARDFTTVPCSTVQKMQVTCRWRLEASGSYVDRRYGEQALVAHMRSLVVGGEQPGTYGSRRAARFAAMHLLLEHTANATSEAVWAAVWAACPDYFKNGKCGSLYFPDRGGQSRPRCTASRTHAVRA
jgi:hypothetical protein